MASYEILIKKDVEAELRSLTKSDLEKVVARIQSLSANPRPAGSEKLKGQEGYRVRQGNYRIVYLVDDASKVVRIVKVGHRREVYR